MATSLKATVTATTEVKLKLSVKRRLTTELRAYADLKAQLDTIKGKMEAINGRVEAIRLDVGEKKFGLDGFKIARVEGQRKKLNVKTLLGNGCALAWYEDALEMKPNKPYTLISVPGEKERHDEEES